MEIDFLDLFVWAAILITYGIICFISLILSLSRETFQAIEEALNTNLISNKIVNPVIESNINFINEWLLSNNKVVGPILVILSLLDIKILFTIWNSIR